MHTDGSARGEIVERLAAIGVEEREAKLFVHLCLSGPSRASDAAAATRLKRTETYRALESLMKRGFVTAHLTRPVVYEAVQPDSLFAEILSEHEGRRAEIERLRERVTEAVKEARKEREIHPNRYSYKIIQGRRPILAAADAALRQARVSEDMVSTTFSAAEATLQNRAWQTMLRRAADGFPIRLLLRGSPGLERALQPLLAHPNVHVRFLEVDHAVRFVVLDGREIVYWLVSDPSNGVDARDDVAMWTNAPDFVRAQQTLFDALWREAREVVRATQRA